MLICIAAKVTPKKINTNKTLKGPSTLKAQFRRTPVIVSISSIVSNKNNGRINK